MAGKDTNGAGVTTIDRTVDGTADADRKPESGSAEPQTFGFPAPISPIDASFNAEQPNTERRPRKPRRDAGQPRGAYNVERGDTAKTAPDLSDLKALIFSAHQMMSAIVPELELDNEEAKRYADATQNLMKHYDHRVNPKVMAWLQFSCAVGGIYGPRAVAIYKRMEGEAAQRPKPQVASSPRAAQAQPGPVKPWSETAPSELFGTMAAPIEDRK
jgi:hypothetical protein